MNEPQQHAFTLVELSIVLVILGLLVGGVLTGQTLIRAAELRSVTTQYSRYVTATHTFRDKYFGLPGDLTNATSYWGVAHATPSTCVTTASTDSKTCNGDGNGKVMVTTDSNEPFRYWQQLANAGLIEGSYSGITHGTTTFSTTTANAPAGRTSGSLWFLWNWGVAQTGQATFFDGDYGNRMSIGGYLVNSEPGSGIFKSEEVYNIDAKLDDGKPARGKVMTIRNNNCTDSTTSADLDANYILTSASGNCRVMFPNAF